VSEGIETESTAPWRRVLKDPDVRDWHEKLAMRSTLTSDEYVRVLDRYCTAVKTTPAAIVTRAKDQDGGRRVVEHALQAFVIAMQKPHKPSSHAEDDDDAEAVRRCSRGHVPGYVNRFPKVLRSYLDHHDVVLRKIFVGDTDSTLVENEPLLTPDQLRDVVTAASPRGRVIIALVAWSGLRPEVLGKHDASDGLTIGDLPDVDVANHKVAISHRPIQVVVRRELSKIRKRYFSFLCAEGVEYLREYLERRQANGEDLSKESPIVRPDYNRGYDRRGRPEPMRGSGFLETAAITSEIRVTLRRRGLHVRPYALRNYFVSRLESALRDGEISIHDKLFFEGRKTAIDMRYSHHKQLPPETIEEMRTEYAKAEPYLGVKLSPSSVGEWNLTPTEIEVLKGLLAQHVALGARGQGHLRIPQALGERFESTLDPDAGRA
jgi:hypothetical protein